jgi:hypothetical protein
VCTRYFLFSSLSLFAEGENCKYGPIGVKHDAASEANKVYFVTAIFLLLEDEALPAIFGLNPLFSPDSDRGALSITIGINNYDGGLLVPPPLGPRDSSPYSLI